MDIARPRPVEIANASLRDRIALMKPGIMVMSVMTMAVGMAIAPGHATGWTWLIVCVGTALLVGAANALNMYIERDVDKLMDRTKGRPLPAGRMASGEALVLGLLSAVVSLLLLGFAVNGLTAMLGFVALFSYVCLYTPLKRVTSLATLIGAVPGAIPPLMGWTAKTGTLHPAILVVGALLFFWQIPHFHAIALFRKQDYLRAGLKTLPGSTGLQTGRAIMLPYLAAQVLVSIWLFPMGVAGLGYLVVAAGTGAVYFAYALFGSRIHGEQRWARNMFLVSIIYLPAVYLALVLSSPG